MFAALHRLCNACMSCQDTLRAHISDRKFGSLDDRISRPAVPETYASYAWIGLSEPAIVGLPIPGVRLTRFQGDNGASTPGIYPGLDRFGRVVRQMWVNDGFAVVRCTVS
jgi:hypothetical protein